jgi:predicted esterase
MLEYIDHIESATSPTLVLLHGYGSNKEDLFGLHPYFKGINLVCFQAPIAMGMGDMLGIRLIGIMELKSLTAKKYRLRRYSC